MAFTALGETVLVESRTTGGTTGGITANPPYHESAGSWSGSGSHTAAPGVTSGIGSRFGYATNCVLRITPTLQPNTTYRMYISHISLSCSADIVINVAYEGCVGTVSSTTNFNNKVANSWEFVGDITVDDGVTQPTIVFSYASGTIASSGSRWYSDAFRFVSDACAFAALPEITAVTGPLAAGQTFVNVPGVAATASGVVVYAAGVEIGRKTSGVTAGVNRVETSALVKDAVITATQIDQNAVETCRPSTGPAVGGGPNPRVRISLSLRENTTLTGPIGANATATGTLLKFLGATTNVSGALTPIGGKVIYPSNDWQTVTFERGPDPANPVDPVFQWNGSPVVHRLNGNFAGLESIAFAIDDLTDNGPFEIYIDELRNGNTLVQGWEDFNHDNQSVLFLQPTFSGTTLNFLLAPSPDVSQVNNEIAVEGGNSYKASWQFKDTNAVNWMRFVAQGSGSPNPQLDLRLPISFRMLLLPVGSSVPQVAPVIQGHPQNVSVVEGSTVSLRVGAYGAQALSYQWYKDGELLADKTNKLLRITAISPSQAGDYSVVVSNSLGRATSNVGTVAVSPTVISSVMTTLWAIPPGSRSYMTNDNRTRGIAYNSQTDHLLLASRSGNSNAIYVFNATNGTLVKMLQMTNSSGLIASNIQKIAVAADGGIVATTFTSDGTTQPIRVYTWVDEDSPPSQAFEGDPTAGGNLGSPVPARWGDTMAVVGNLNDLSAKVFLGARDERMIAALDLSGLPPEVYQIPDTDLGDFSYGFAVGPGRIAWGKRVGGPLRRVFLDQDSYTGHLSNSITAFPNMGLIGWDGGHLFAGITFETADNLRLYNISDLNNFVNLDTEFFGGDNPNPQVIGDVVFGGNKVFAYNANNGLIAMSINEPPPCPTGVGLTLTRLGDHEIQLSWNAAGLRLQATSSLEGTATQWQDINSPSPVSVTAQPGEKRFYRLTCP